MALEFKRNKLNVKDGSGDFVEIPVLGEQKTEKATVGELAIEVSRATAAEEAIAARVDKLQKVVGSPFVAATAASMTNTDRVYVYTGSETGYTAGNWYYYDGTAWVSGGVYNSAGVNVDDTLTYEGMAADAKATGDEFNNVKNAINQKQDAPSTAGTAGQVLGLDSNLDPVWVNQSGSGDTSNCAPVIINTASGDIATFTDGADNRQIRKIVGTIETAEGGSGWTGANISRSGKNLFNKNDPNMTRGIYFNRNGSTSTNINYAISYVPINPGDKLVYSGLKGANGNPCGIQFFDANKTFLAMGNPDAQQNNVTVTAPSGAAYIGITVFYWSNVAYKDIDTAQIELGTVPSEYESYQETTIPIGWQSQAGIILNGTVTLNEDRSADVLNSDSGNSYHLSNVGSLSTFLGANRVWIDTGSITECDYPADTKLYIDGLTEPDEDMIANANIASGKYFVVNNQLYLSTAAIAAGASIIPGTNCTATSLAEALNAINT